MQTDPGLFNAWEVLRDNPLLGKRVAIIGGGAVGLETALFVAAKGTITPEILHFLFTYEAESIERLRELMFQGASRVTVFEMLPKAGKDVGKSTKWILTDNLKRYGVKVNTGTKVISIRGGTLSCEKDGESFQEVFDSVILASGSRPVQQLSSDIASTENPLYGHRRLHQAREDKRRHPRRVSGCSGDWLMRRNDNFPVEFLLFSATVARYFLIN